MTRAVRRAVHGVFAAVAFVASGTAGAQDAASLAIHQRLAVDYPAPAAARLLPDVVAAMGRAAATWHGCTPTQATIVSVTPASADQIVIAQIVQKAAHTGWIVVASPKGCPDRAPVRLLATERPDGTLAVGVFAIGDGLAWPSLVRDAQLPAMIAADRAMDAAAPRSATCEERAPHQIDGAILSRDPALAAPSYGVVFKGGWRERWTYAFCGRTAAVTVDFAADGDGGANFSIGPAS